MASGREGEIGGVGNVEATSSDDMSQLHVRSRRRLVPACIPDEQFGATLYIVRKATEGRDSPSSTGAVLMSSCG